MTDAIQSRLRKLALLASQGIGGEKENAEVIFQRLCKKHGFEPADFINADARIIDTIISVKASDEKALLHNILAMVTDDHNASIWWTRGRATRLTIRTTAAQAAEVRFLFSIYRHAWKKEKERLYTAFLHKHDLFPATPSSTSSSRPLSREESARLRAMMDGMDSVTPSQSHLKQREGRVMARIRSLHPGQWTDEDFVSCGPYARLLALALRNEADDNGVFEWKPVGLKMRLFPVDNIDIVELLAELVTFNQIARFEYNGKAYGVIRNFARYQRPKRPKPVHYMPDQFRTYIGLDAICSDIDDDEDAPVPTLGEMPPVQSASVPTMGELDPVQVTSVPPKSEIAPQMKEEGGRRYKKEEVRVSNETLTLGASACDFEDFRGIYPKPDGLSAAKADWDAALKAGASPKAILGGLKRSIGAWRESQTAPRFIPNAARWLSERRWEDGQSAPATAPPKTLWHGPPDIRATVVNARSESFAVSYLDPCTWDETIDAILTPTTIACDKLRQIAQLSGLLIERQPKPAEAA